MEVTVRTVLSVRRPFYARFFYVIVWSIMYSTVHWLNDIYILFSVTVLHNGEILFKMTYQYKVLVAR
jgi:hypothetical protein